MCDSSGFCVAEPELQSAQQEVVQLRQEVGKLKKIGECWAFIFYVLKVFFPSIAL